MIAVRLADVVSPLRNGALPGSGGVSALVAGGTERIRSGEAVVFCKVVAVAPAVVRRDGRVQAAGSPAGHARLGPLERWLDDWAGPGAVEKVAERAVLDPRFVKGARERLLTRAFMIRVIVLMTLVPDAGVRDAVLALAGDLAGVPWARPWRAASERALGDWRNAAGPGPLEDLLSVVLEASRREHEARGWREAAAGLLKVGSLDGTLVRVPDTPANREAFGSSGTADGSSPFPQVRALPLNDVSTRGLLGMTHGPSGGGKGKAAGEQKLLDDAMEAYPHLFAKDRLWLMDRNFPGAARLARLIARTHVLVRLTSDIPLKRVSPILADGSYMADLSGDGLTVRVRVTGYHVTVEGQDVPEMFCLVTDLTDIRQYPAADLAGLYKWRWAGSETALDALMVDSARSIIEWAVAHGRLPKSSLAAARPPYGFKRPGYPPTQEHLDQRYPHGEGTTEETSHGSMYISVLSFGDFGRYVIESGMQHFSRIPLDQPYPTREPTPEPRFLITRYRKFKKSLSADLAARAAALFESKEPSSGFEREFQQFISELSDKQSNLLGECWQRPAQRSMPDPHYPSKRAQRWVFQRTMTLGWTPQLFGRFDRSLNYHDAGREAHKPERFGKKYQWIAYHELLARVADNYHYDPSFGGESGKFDGIYQLNDREIDPSLPPVSYREFQERLAVEGTWRPTGLHFSGGLPAAVDFRSYRDDYQAFLNDKESLPYPNRVAQLTDANGQPWLILNAHEKQGIRPEGDDSKLPADRQFHSLYTWLVLRSEALTTSSALPRELQGGFSSSHLVDSNGHVDCCYFGELGWREMQCPYRYDAPSTVTAKDGAVLTLTPTVESYLWEGMIWDCSIEDSVKAVVPSTFIQRSSNLRWSGDSASWHDGDELVMAYMECDSADHQGTMFVVKEDWIKDYLAIHDLVLVYAVQGQREHRDGERDFSWIEFELSGSYTDGILAAGISLITAKDNKNISRSATDLLEPEHGDA